ncbi:hypothetical protein pqer_cds_672 [Pandoravirus quercus]|uniref:Uncharacterized protein n=1 Tax=Pandoravirus quercus TaxID=2107709 RepID=A0A2U7U9I6_9VIRU|nr:hypothetical protein pqer_cds_672 [Pandoravirus quercus]AVK75094.1 hypothetical protein pqer_cds_672 [Pandoravirus quercus]
MGDGATDCFALLGCAMAFSVLAACVITVGTVPTVERVHDLVSLHGRLHSAECRVAGHVDVATEIRDGRPRYLAGLLVDFETTDHLAIVNATALTNIEPERAWLTAAERGRFYTGHPIGSTLRCTYDDRAPHESVATSSHVTDYGSRVAVGVLSVMATSAVALLAAAPAILFGLYVCALCLFCAGKRLWAGCALLLALRPYLVVGGDSSTPSDHDAADQQL